MLNEIKRFISRNGLMRHDRRYVVALSGGADSVALLRVLLELGYQLDAAHCNFHLRGSESDRDETFCDNLCSQLNVPLHTVHFDTRQYATAHKVSIEMAARDLRYAYFNTLCDQLGADGVCVAHHADDQAETILLNLVRGAGAKGLEGMAPKRGRIIRAMLCVTRSDIQEYLKSIGQDYVTDSSNLIDDVARNIIRLDVMPQLRRINPNATENILRSATNIAETDAMARMAADQIIARAQSEDYVHSGLSVKAMLGSPSPLYVLWRIANPLGFNRVQCEEMLSSTGGGRHEWQSATHVAVMSRDRLYFHTAEEWRWQLPVITLPHYGKYSLANVSIEVSLHNKTDLGEGNNGMRTHAMSVNDSEAKALIDASSVHFPLTLRPAETGDRFTPFGMTGSKLVSRYARDRKLPPLAVHRLAVVADADGHILWLVGQTIDNHYAVTASTSKVLVLRFIQEPMVLHKPV